MNSRRNIGVATFFLAMFLLIACSPSVEVSTPTNVAPTATIQLATPTLIGITETATPVGKKNEIPYEDFNLLWSECQITPDGLDNYEWAFQCLKFQRRVMTDEEMNLRSKSSINYFNFLDQRLVVGDDIYEARLIDRVDSGEGFAGFYRYHLTVNGELIVEAIGHFMAYDINGFLLNVNGKVAWEFADVDHPTIFFDGENLLTKYSLEAAYYPDIMNGKLIFIAKKDGRYFVMYDGQKVGSEFDQITVQHMIGLAYTVVRLPNLYLFWGTRGGQQYVVAISGKLEK